ncbi:MAG: hypothetical protein HN478_19120 [Rhodospirillaceae bacterium]|jgi:hypothetical protein|nr:hypothetical protein [Rhodospirillaceae bacterium]MBT4487688.1 hypothetical protein [Rhodospirillaceae bacterium]MBT5195703.1 hypothetical protein [Rhodospirillaceae bacterium]MBT5895276.1 hypothetical protein [Rhodospirillaceae bacterium]MBT6428688.1 hypothetical protein [Rhodospirillaceae bacterium]
MTRLLNWPTMMLTQSVHDDHGNHLTLMELSRLPDYRTKAIAELIEFTAANKEPTLLDFLTFSAERPWHEWITAGVATDEGDWRHLIYSQGWARMAGGSNVGRSVSQAMPRPLAVALLEIYKRQEVTVARTARTITNGLAIRESSATRFSAPFWEKGKIVGSFVFQAPSTPQTLRNMQCRLLSSHLSEGSDPATLELRILQDITRAEALGQPLNMKSLLNSSLGSSRTLRRTVQAMAANGIVEKVVTEADRRAISLKTGDTAITKYLGDTYAPA